MNSMLTLALVLCCAAYTWACCTPDQWEGGEGSVGGYAKMFKKGAIRENSYISYDATNKRSSVFLNYVNGDYENKFHIVTRFEEDDDCKCGRMYILDEKKKECTVKRLEKFRKACIPEDAKSFGEYYMGLKGGFKVQGFTMHKGPIFASVTVANLDDKTCVPVGEVLAGSLRRVSFMQTIGFVDITPGIKNETVFAIPEECKDVKETDELLEASLERDHFVLAI